MTNPNSGGPLQRPKGKIPGADIPLEHYLRMVIHRKWLILAVFLVVTAGTAVYAWLLPNIYTSYTTILVDPQKVPEFYVKSTVTGDVRNRISALSNEILSSTQLQKIIDTLGLYPEERKKLAREDVIAKMHRDISTTVVNDFAGNQDLQAFRIQYSGRDPRLVSQVASRLAGAFIDENAKNREQQADDTAKFIENQLDETRKLLETQEAKIKDFNLQHIGQLPEQQTAFIQVESQLQAQLQIETDALNNAQNRRKELVAALTQAPAKVVDMDPPGETTPAGPAAVNKPHAPGVDPLAAERAQLAALLTRYSVNHPDVVRLKHKIAQDEALAKAKAAATPVAVVVPSAVTPNAAPSSTTHSQEQTIAVADSGPHFNPVVQSQIHAVDEEIARHTQVQQGLNKQLAAYRARLDSIPVTQQELAALTRDYEISKARYSQLLDRRMTAETATELEVRQKGEKFDIIDPAVPAERPTSPVRWMIDLGGAVAGLVLGLLAALSTEFFGMAITDSQDVAEATGVGVLGVIPVIMTQSDQIIRRRRWIMGLASTMGAAVIAGVVLFLKLRNQA